jgi:hypothetical protein
MSVHSVKREKSGGQRKKWIYFAFIQIISYLCRQENINLKEIIKTKSPLAIDKNYVAI